MEGHRTALGPRCGPRRCSREPADLRCCWQSGLFAAGVLGLRNICCSLSGPSSADDLGCCPLSTANRSFCTPFSQPFCERCLGPLSPLDKLFFFSCDLHVLHVVLAPSQTTTHMWLLTRHLTWGGGCHMSIHKPPSPPPTVVQSPTAIALRCPLPPRPRPLAALYCRQASRHLVPPVDAPKVQSALVTAAQYAHCAEQQGLADQLMRLLLEGADGADMPDTLCQAAFPLRSVLGNRTDCPMAGVVTVSLPFPGVPRRCLCMCLCVCVGCPCVCVCVCVCVCAHASVCVCMCLCLSLSLSVCVCGCLCLRLCVWVPCVSERVCVRVERPGRTQGCCKRDLSGNRAGGQG